MQKLKSTPILTACLAILISTASGCDDFSWEEVNRKFDSCLAEFGLKSLLNKNVRSKTLCNKLDELEDCVGYLAVCEDTHYDMVEDKIEAFNVDKLSQKCHEVTVREKRSAEPGRSRSSSSSSGGRTRKRDRIKQKAKDIGRRIKDKVKSKITGRKTNRGYGNTGGYGNNYGSNSGYGNRGIGGGGFAGGVQPKKESRRKKILKKVGKYAVVGLAAYGTYKLAKKMSKSLRSAYDNDDCWEYNLFRGQYECKCYNNQCNEYVGGSAVAMALTSMLLAASTFVTFFVFRRSNYVQIY